MRSKGTIGKSVCIVLAVSMIGMGTPPSIPKAFADSLSSGTAASADSSSTGNSTSSSSVITNDLSKLDIVKPDGTTLDEQLNDGTLQYSATVDNSVSTITLQVKSDNENAVIKVNGQQVLNGTSSPISLNTGDNSIEISVNDGVNPASTYTLTVTREKSSNNLLSNIQLSKGLLSPKFDAATTTYYVSLTNDVNTLSITPVLADKSASMTVNGTKATDTGVSVQIPVGKSEISIIVTAENGEQKTYKIDVTREEKTGQTSPSPSNGSGMGFSKTGSYTGSKIQSSSHPISGYSKNNSQNTSALKQNNFTMNSRGGSWGQSSQQGAAAVQKPSTATLSTLTVSAGTWNKTFAKDTYTYHIAVSKDVDSVTLVDTTTYSGASVTINGSASNAIQLGNQAKTIIPIVVTNGSDRKTYVLVFDKAVPEPNTTATTTTENTSMTAATESSTGSTGNYNSAAGANYWNNRNSRGNASWWIRLINSIKSFFSNL